MPHLEISNLPNAPAVNGTEEIPVSRAGTTYRMSAAELVGTIGGSGIPADTQPARLTTPVIAAGRYNWNASGLWSNDTWQAGGYLDSTESPVAWRRPVGSYDKAAREVVDLSAIPDEPFGTFEGDSHNGFAVAVDRNDNVIVFANHHNDPVNWVYWDASQADPDFTDPTQWTVGGTMVDDGDEDQVTYFTFHYDHARDRLLLHHSCGVGAGNSSRYINLWNPNTLTWSRVCHFLDGESTSPTQTAYPSFAVREDGRIACFFTWHVWGATSKTDHNLSYAYSDNGGVTWRRQSDGSAYDLPIRFDTGDNHEAEVIYPVASGTSLNHPHSTAFDADGNPWMVIRGENQVRFIMRWDGDSWVRTDMPTQYTALTMPGPGALFRYDGRMYLTDVLPLRGRDGDLLFIDVTDPEDPQEFPVINRLASQGMGGDFDVEALRLRGKWEKQVGPMINNGQANAWTGVPLVLASIDLDQLPVLRTGNAAPIGIDEVVEKSSATGDTWTVEGASFSLIPQAPRWIAPPDQRYDASLVLARLSVIGAIASGTTMSVGLFAGYDPNEPAPAIGSLVQFGYVNITNALEAYTSGWLVVPVIPFGEGFLYPYQVYLAALASGVATGTIEHLGLEVGVVGGVRFP